MLLNEGVAVNEETPTSEADIRLILRLDVASFRYTTLSTEPGISEFSASYVYVATAHPSGHSLTHTLSTPSYTLNVPRVKGPQSSLSGVQIDLGTDIYVIYKSVFDLLFSIYGLKPLCTLLTASEVDLPFNIFEKLNADLAIGGGGLSVSCSRMGYTQRANQ
jgi:hypothetical protein